VDRSGEVPHAELISPEEDSERLDDVWAPAAVRPDHGDRVELERRVVALELPA
jgi:hypothetical protein